MAEALQIATRLGSGGRLVIPARLRRSLGLHTRAELVLSLRNGAISVWSREAARRWAQDQVCKLVPPEVSPVNALIRNRQCEAELE
jgi:bifunctional DNA-binding transcriptional regulator/antitoxin component of YhaV-PrlF toxin-antitoxin module